MTAGSPVDEARARWVRGRGRYWQPASPEFALAAIAQMRAVLTRAQTRNPIARRYP